MMYRLAPLMVQSLLIVSLLLSIAIISYYLWSIPNLNIGPLNPLLVPLGMFLSLMGLAGIIWVYTVFPPTAIATSTLATFRWAYYKLVNKRVPTEKRRLVISGPYLCVRHPLYSSVLLVFLGLGLLTGFLLLAVPILFIIYYLVSAIEEKEMVEIHGDEYIKYQKRVTRLNPLPLLLGLVFLVYLKVVKGEKREPCLKRES